MNSIVLAEMPVVFQTEEAVLRDLGDGIVCLEFLSKGNSITPPVKSAIGLALDRLATDFDGLVIGNQAKNFSVGANLNTIKTNIDRGDFQAFDESISLFQHLNLRIKHTSKPIVAAPYRNTLGGGLEVSLHCHARVALEKSYMGLVEVGVGVLPGGGGTKECALQIGHAAPEQQAAVVKTMFEKILLRKVSANAHEAKEMLYLSPNDRVVSQPDELLPTAKAVCLNLIGKGHSRLNGDDTVIMPGKAVYNQMIDYAEALLKEGAITPYDFEIGKYIAFILSGASEAPSQLSEEDLLELERTSFLELVRQKGTYDRICYFLENNALLRN